MPLRKDDSAHDFSDNKKPLPFAVRRLISLWDMVPFVATKIWGSWYNLTLCRNEAQQQAIQHGADHVMASEFVQQLLANLKTIREDVCQALELEGATRSLDLLEVRLSSGPCSATVLASDVFRLSLDIMEDAHTRQFAFIPQAKANYFEKEKLFGDAVFDVFEEARSDIKSVGNCLAAELPTAAVFHLMRVAELGLRVLAKTIRVKLPAQIEFLTWGQVIAAIDQNLNKLKGKSRAKDKKVQLYRGLLLEINAFKDLWRNPVMHARSQYDENKALSAFNSVRAFMQRLSEQELNRRRSK